MMRDEAGSRQAIGPEGLSLNYENFFHAEGVKGELSCTPEACWENSRGKRVERAQPLENGA